MKGSIEQHRGVLSFPPFLTANWNQPVLRRCRRYGKQWQITYKLANTLVRIGRCSIITVAGLHPVIFIVGFNLDAAERVVALGVSGLIAEGVLIPQLFLNLIKDFT